MKQTVKARGEGPKPIQEGFHQAGDAAIVGGTGEDEAVGRSHLLVEGCHIVFELRTGVFPRPLFGAPATIYAVINFELGQIYQLCCHAADGPSRSEGRFSASQGVAVQPRAPTYANNFNNHHFHTP